MRAKFWNWVHRRLEYWWHWVYYNKCAPPELVKTKNWQYSVYYVSKDRKLEPK